MYLTVKLNINKHNIMIMMATRPPQQPKHCVLSIWVNDVPS